MRRPIIIEKYADNGDFSHYELIDPLSSVILWTEKEDNSIKLPKWKDCADKVEIDKDLNSIENFVFFEEPRDSQDGKGWREELQEAINYISRTSIGKENEKSN